MILFAALLAVIAAFSFGLKFAAEFGDKKAFRHLQALRRRTPSHTYTAHDGSQGRWP